MLFRSKAYEGYVNALNKGALTKPVEIDRLNFNKSFNLLLEHMNLAKDYKHYMDCLNVIADPNGFHQLHDKIYDAMKYAMFDHYQKQRIALQGALAAKELEDAIRAQMEEQERAKQEELRAQQEEAAKTQVAKLSEMLTNIEKDIKALQDEQPDLEKAIAEADKKAKELEDDLQAVKELLEIGRAHV